MRQVILGLVVGLLIGCVGIIDIMHRPAYSDYHDHIYIERKDNTIYVEVENGISGNYSYATYSLE